MPTNWDELLNQYDTTFNPKYPKTDPFSYPQQSQAQSQMGFGGQIPEYDFAPMRRYKDYLGSEPTREEYKPGKFGTILNSLSAGFESMDNGLGRGAALYDALEERDYNKAYKGWQNRATKYKTDVDLENTRYRTATTDYDRAQDNLRQADSVAATVRNADVNEQRLALEEKKYQDSGFQLSDGPNGTRVGVRLRGGQPEQVPTDIPNTNLTPQQRIDQFNTSQDNAMKRWREPSGSARLGAQTSTRNVDRGITARASEGELNRQSREREGFQNRQSQEWRDVTGPTRSGPAEKVATPVNTRTPMGYVQNDFNGQFNRPEFIEVDPKGEVTIIESDTARIGKGLRELAAKTGRPMSELIEEHKAFIAGMKTRFGGQ